MPSSTLTSNTGYMPEIKPLTGTNFSTWRDQVKLTLRVMDLNHALRIDPPAALTAESTVDHKRAHEQWERSNRMSLMIIKNSISVAIRGAIPDSENANEYLSSVDKQFKGTSKAHESTLILKMLTTKYDGINYNTQKKKWKMSELIAMCVQEEERLKVEKPDIIHVAATNSNNRKGSWKGKDNQFLESLLSFNVNENVNQNNRKQDPKSSSKLWHQRLGHISQDRMTRLLKDEVLPNLDFSDFEKCVECIKGKMTKGNKKGATRSTRLLKLTHTDICGPFPSGIGCHKSFITFTDDYLRYMYLFLINEKSESLKIFKTFKAEVENQLDHKIKVVRSDMGGEYYGTHTDVGQAPESFFDFCKDHGIINQYTMPEFLENANNSGSRSFRRIKLQEARDETPIIHVPIPINAPLDTSNDHLIAQDHPNNVEETESNSKINVEPHKLNNRKCNDLESFEDAITCDQSAHWMEVMEDELDLMSKNKVWELAKLLKGAKPIGCKLTRVALSDGYRHYQKFQLLLCDFEISLQSRDHISYINHAKNSSKLSVLDVYLFFVHLLFYHPYVADDKRVCFDDNILELRFEECSKDIKYSWNVLTSILKLVHSLIVVWNHDFLGAEELYAHASYIFTRLRKKEAAQKDKKHTKLPSTPEMETAPDYKGTAITPGNEPEKLQV
nr:putative zinc finger, CCHC-type [Tanacetum cinerariifolium]